MRRAKMQQRLFGFVPAAARYLLTCVALFMAPGVWAAVPHLELDVRLDPAQHVLRATGSLTLPPGEPVRLSLWGASEVATFTLDGRPLQGERVKSGMHTMWRWTLRPPTGQGSRLAFEYILPLRGLDTALDHRQVLGAIEPSAGDQGVFVPANAAWYPQPETPATHRIAIDVTGAMRALVPGRLVAESRHESGYRAVFESTTALPGLDLLAGPYAVTERRVALDATRTVRVRTYFHDELKDLAEPYLESAARYIARYDRLIGPYLHGGYSVVSAPIPTGFGMPGIAYLGREVIRLPFIRATSLGHEVLHDWWGNGVYPRYAQGNWSEGLTTFLADYAFKEDEGDEAARLMREGWLRDYAAVPAAQDRALAAFVSRRHGADQAVGYGKTAFVFFMLRDAIGEEAFRSGLRAFWKQYAGRSASWHDLERAFAAASARDLSAYFRQWVTRAGAPSIRVASARRIDGGAGGEKLQILLRQEVPPYHVRTPVRVHLADGRTLDAIVDFAGAEGRTEIALPARAAAVELDPQARIFRRVEPDEVAPVLRQVLLDPDTRVVTSADPEVRTAALAVAQAALDHAVQTTDIAAAAGGKEALFIAAKAGEVQLLVERLGLPPVPASLSEVRSAYVYAGRTRNGRSFVVVNAPDAAAMRALGRSLPHLGGQSFAVFEGARSVTRGIWPASARRVPVEGW